MSFSDGNVLVVDTILNGKGAIYLWHAPSWEEIGRAEAAHPNVTATTNW